MRIDDLLQLAERPAMRLRDPGVTRVHCAFLERSLLSRLGPSPSLYCKLGMERADTPGSPAREERLDGVSLRCTA